ncbi:MAG: PAS domain S-box protein [Sandaracinaceae bacterium]|nr:PAS domain S-box protein [Sandaracinaceae bacterium]
MQERPEHSAEISLEPASGEAVALAASERSTRAMLELTQALASSLEMSDILYTVVRRIAEIVNVERVSVVLAPAGDAGPVGYVVAASDNQGITNLRIDLDKYPEIQEVLRTRAPLTIEDASTHPVLEGVRGDVPTDKLGPLTLVPITWQDETMGVLFLRIHVSASEGRAGRAQLSRRELEFCQIAANATAIALRNARVMQTLRDQTQQVSFARFEAERRLRNLKRYANLFTSAADGLVAVDGEGRVLFANPRAYEIAGVEESDVRDRPLTALLDPRDHLRAVRLWRGVKRGHYPHGVDLRVARKGPGETRETRIFSCSFSPLQETDGAVLFSFRDVTPERTIALELAKTKEFLESIIHASVDAIIAASASGEILLFNPGAERITGWKASEMVGKRPVSALYPDDGAREVMRMIRSPQYGGPGRLEAIRWEVLDREGRRVPVQLSAATITDGQGRPSGTVGVFTDLRDKLRIERRLTEAQQKLADTERQALIAELAGTAAHELNQPLTSVIAYSELLLRKTIDGDPVHRAASVITSEAHRMADIVRKIGKITRYETKSYVGTQKILDLDRSAAEESDRAPESARPPVPGAKQ